MLSLLVIKLLPKLPSPYIFFDDYDKMSKKIIRDWFFIIVVLYLKSKMFIIVKFEVKIYI